MKFLWFENYKHKKNAIYEIGKEILLKGRNYFYGRNEFPRPYPSALCWKSVAASKHSKIEQERRENDIEKQ